MHSKSNVCNFGVNGIGIKLNWTADFESKTLPTVGQIFGQNWTMTLNLTMGDDENLNAWNVATKRFASEVRIFVNEGNTFKLVGQPLSSNKIIDSSLYSVIAIKWPAQISYGP